MCLFCNKSSVQNTKKIENSIFAKKKNTLKLESVTLKNMRFKLKIEPPPPPPRLSRDTGCSAKIGLTEKYIILQG